MSKRSLLIEPDLQNLAKELKEYLNVSQKEIKETYKKNVDLWKEREESLERFNAIFDNSKLELESKKELNKIAEGMGVTLEKDSALIELQERIETLPEHKTITDKQLHTLLKEIEKNQDKFMLDRMNDVSALLKCHSIIAEENKLKSKDKQEIILLDKFSEGAKKLSESIDKVSNKIIEGKSERSSQRIIHKVVSTITNGLKKLYGEVENYISESKAIGFIKTLGQKLVSAVKSLFNKTLNQQNNLFASVINDTSKALNQQENKPNIAAAKELLKKQFLKLQDNYSKVILSERQAVFNKWKENKNIIIDKMSIKELYTEVQKMRKGISAQVKRNAKEKYGKFTQKILEERGDASLIQKNFTR